MIIEPKTQPLDVKTRPNLKKKKIESAEVI